MANTKSAAKRARQIERRTLQNKNALTQVKNQIKTTATAVKSASKDAATKEASKLVSVLDRAVKTGRIHRNAANRRKSRLAKRIASLA